MTHMVLWMRRHARGLRREMEGLNRAAEHRAPGALPLSQPWPWRGRRRDRHLPGAWPPGRAGERCCRRLWQAFRWRPSLPGRLRGACACCPQHQVLRVSAHLLLLFAAGMLVLGTDRLIGMEWIPPGPTAVGHQCLAGRWRGRRQMAGRPVGHRASCGRQCAGLLCVLGTDGHYSTGGRHGPRRQPWREHTPLHFQPRQHVQRTRLARLGDMMARRRGVLRCCNGPLWAWYFVLGCRTGLSADAARRCAHVQQPHALCAVCFLGHLVAVCHCLYAAGGASGAV